MRPRHNWLASLYTSASPPHSPTPYPHPYPHRTSKEMRNMTTNSLSKAHESPTSHALPGVAEMGVGLRRGGVMGEPEVNEIIGKVRCEFVTEV